MNEQNPNPVSPELPVQAPNPVSPAIPAQNELLYNPKNWAFLAFFLSPIVPGIFFNRNCKLLGLSSTGNKVFFGTIFFVIFFIVLAVIFSQYSTYIIFAEAILSVIIAKQLAKTQVPAYEKMKVDKGLKGGRSEASVILIFIAIWVFTFFILPFIYGKYLEENSPTFFFRGEEISIE